MRSLTRVLVVVCVAHKLRACPSYSRRRDRINLGLLRSLYRGGGGVQRLTAIGGAGGAPPHLLPSNLGFFCMGPVERRGCCSLSVC